MNLTTDPIPGLVRRIAVPASVGFFFNTMYNFVDTYFGGQISVEALAALSLSFPVFFLVIAASSGVGQGSTALMAHALGANDREGARSVLAQAIVFTLLLGVALTVGGFIAAPALFRLLGAKDGYLDVALAYMNVIVAASSFFLLQGTLNAGLNAQGDTRVFRNMLFAGFVLNCVLDPWFLYGGLGVPAMGIRGIALATALIQVVGCVYIFSRLRRSPLWEGMHAHHFRPDLAAFRRIAGQAFPASLNMLTVAAGIFVITWFASRFGKEAVAGYGIATRVEQVVLLPTIGLNYAVLTLVGQNNGAGRPDRVREAWAASIRMGAGLMAIGGALVFLLRGPAMRLFTDDAVVAELGSNYLSVAALTLSAYPILFVTVFSLQGLRRPAYGLWIGIYRQIVAPWLVFNALAFGLGLGLWGLWWGISIVTWSASLFTLWYGRRTLARLVPARGETSGTPGVQRGRYGTPMRWTFVVVVLAAVLVAFGAALVLPDHEPPARVWALEAPDADGVPMPVRIALQPGGDALDDFDLTAGCGGGGMGGNITHFLTIRRGAASHLRDLVRLPPPPTLGYRRRRHVVVGAEGEWRELVWKNPDGSDPPVPGGEALAGAWEHVSGDGHTWGLTLRADGTLDVAGDAGGEGQGDWTRTGTTLVLALDLAPDGIWPTGSDHVENDASCEIGADGASYAGTDRSGRAVSGRRSPAH